MSKGLQIAIALEHIYIRGYFLVKFPEKNGSISIGAHVTYLKFYIF